MALHPDPHADRDFRAFLDALAQEGLPRRAEAARATEAVACALALRLRDPDFEPLRELLPEPFRGRVVACERHSKEIPPEFSRLEDFLGIVGEDLEMAAEEAEPVARAVFHALRVQLPEEAEEEVSRRLPDELQPLWALAS